MFELTVSNLNAFGGEPRILDLTVAERLDFVRPRAIRQLIERSKTELESYGFIATRYGAYRNRQFKEYWLNEAQSLLVCVISRTGKAAEVRRSLIEVFTAWRRGQLAPSGQPAVLTRAQLHEINSQAWLRRARWPDLLSRRTRAVSSSKRAIDLRRGCLSTSSWRAKNPKSEASRRTRSVPDARYEVIAVLLTYFHWLIVLAQCPRRFSPWLASRKQPHPARPTRPPLCPDILRDRFDRSPIPTGLQATSVLAAINSEAPTTSAPSDHVGTTFALVRLWPCSATAGCHQRPKVLSKSMI